MDIFNLTHNRLIEYGFSVVELDEIEKLSAIFYRSDVHNVIVKKIHNTEQISAMKSYSISIRNIMIDNKSNIWNTYLLYCISNEIDFETKYRLERDTRALRKYAIQSELDLDRVPFIDRFREIIKPVKNTIQLDEGNPYVIRINDYLEKYDGQQNKLNTNQINEITKIIIDMVESGYENR